MNINQLRAPIRLVLNLLRQLGKCSSLKRGRKGDAKPEILLFSTLLISMLIAVPAVSTAQQLPVPDPINENVNNLCASAQDLGTLTTPFTRDDELQNNGPAERLDFFRFNALPGAELAVSLTGLQSSDNSTPDPFLGWFNSDCQLLAVNDDSDSLDSFLIVTVPDDAVLLLAATTCCDGSFTGEFDSTEISYRLSIEVPPPAIGTIRLQIQNALTFEPLRGGEEPFAYAELYRCLVDCDEFIASIGANSGGQIDFNGKDHYPRLTAGSYLLRVRAEDFSSNESGRFTVLAGDDVSLVVGLDPPPISIGQLVSCENLPPQGGVCNYSVVLNNNSDMPISTLVWSMATGYGIGSPHGYTQFEALRKTLIL